MIGDILETVKGQWFPLQNFFCVCPRVTPDVATHQEPRLPIGAAPAVPTGASAANQCVLVAEMRGCRPWRPSNPSPEALVSGNDVSARMAIAAVLR